MNPICKKLLIAAMAAVLPLAGCSGGSSSDSKPDSAAQAESKPAADNNSSAANADNKQKPESSEQTPSQGDTAEVTKTIGDYEVTMEKAFTQTASGQFTPEDGNTYVVTIFKVKNNSSEAAEISSGANFDATADGADIYQAWMVEPDGYEWIDGTVEPGGTIEGCVCFEAPENFSEIKVNFIPELMESDAVTFTINK